MEPYHIGEQGCKTIVQSFTTAAQLPPINMAVKANNNKGSALSLFLFFSIQPLLSYVSSAHPQTLLRLTRRGHASERDETDLHIFPKQGLSRSCQTSPPVYLRYEFGFHDTNKSKVLWAHRTSGRPSCALLAWG